MQRKVDRVVRAQQTSEGAGVRLKRALGTSQLEYLDPFLLLDEFKSDERDDYVAGFPDHPHCGFETVTYLLAGTMQHRDQLGNEGTLVSGSVQWMTAGRGIIHSEMPRQEDGLLWGFQLWVNLPAAQKMIEPRYQDIAPERVPETEWNGARIRVLAGDVNGVRGPVTGVATEPTYLDVTVPVGRRAQLEIPDGRNAFCYTFEGEGEIGDATEGAAQTVRAGELAVLGEGSHVTLGSRTVPLRLLLLAAQPIGEPVARYGPFVMTSHDEIRQAIDDFRNGRFARQTPGG